MVSDATNSLSRPNRAQRITEIIPIILLPFGRASRNSCSERSVEIIGLNHFVNVPPHIVHPFEVRSPNKGIIRNLIKKHKILLRPREPEKRSHGYSFKIPDCLTFSFKVFKKDFSYFVSNFGEICFKIIGSSVQ